MVAASMRRGLSMPADVPDLAARLAALLGPAGWSPDVGGAGRDWLNRWGAPVLGIARPPDTEGVSAVLRLASEAGLAVVAQGGNTSLNGGAVAMPGRPTVLLSLNRMNRILHIDPTGQTATVEAGVILQDLHDAVAGQGMEFPLHLGSEGSARIGGLIGTNAGGSHAARHGMMEARVLGLEVVLADGTVWNGLRPLIKDNAGYQLRKLFCGSEGTLGIVTRAVLRLEPASRVMATALLATEDLASSVRVGAALRKTCGDLITALEFFPEEGVALLERHVPNTPRPLATRGPAYLLVELASAVAEIPLGDILENRLADLLEQGLVLDATIATNEAQRRSLWRLREEIPEGQRREGMQIKHDIAAPPARLAEAVAEAIRAAQVVQPGVRAIPFGHLTDGNVHFNLSPPENRGFEGQEWALSAAVYDVIDRFGGSIAAEHGLGQAKVALAEVRRPRAERDLMRAIKRALDPKGLLNPGKVLPEHESTRKDGP